MRGRTYTETERIGLMSVALDQGIQETARAMSVPERTLYHWFEVAGGVAAVRNFANEAAARAISDARRAIAIEVQKRAPQLNDEELAEIFRAMLPTQKGDASPAVTVNNLQAKQEQYQLDPEAVAKALLTLRDAGALPSPNGSSEPA